MDDNEIKEILTRIDERQQDTYRRVCRLEHGVFGNGRVGLRAEMNMLKGGLVVVGALSASGILMSVVLTLL